MLLFFCFVYTAKCCRRRLNVSGVSSWQASFKYRAELGCSSVSVDCSLSLHASSEITVI
jgi:hypothetical protein